MNIIDPRLTFSPGRAESYQRESDAPGSEENTLGPDSPDKWSEDPRKKIEQLTRQFKLCRGQLDRKSDLCDELAEQIRGLEGQLEVREATTQDLRGQLRSIGSELRTATHESQVAHREHVEEVAVFEANCRSLRCEREAEEELARRTAESCQEVQADLRSQQSRCGELAKEHSAELVKLSHTYTQELRCQAEAEERREAAQKQVAEELAASSARQITSELAEAKELHIAAQEAREGQEQLRSEERRAVEELESFRNDEEKLHREAAIRETKEQDDRVKEREAWERRFAEAERRAEDMAAKEASAAAARRDTVEADLMAAKTVAAEAREAALVQKRSLEERLLSLEGALRCKEEVAAQVGAERAEAAEARRENRAQADAQAKLLSEAQVEREAAARAEVAKIDQERAKAAGREAQLMRRVDDLQALLGESGEREQQLIVALQHEKELHETCVALLNDHRERDTEESKDVQQELEHMSEELEQKESEMMNIQFDMVELQNKLQDHVRLCKENSDELESGKVQLAEKDERLQVALRRQQELADQMNEATMRLQEKITHLSRELEKSQAAYQTLENHTQKVISRLEADRERMTQELTMAREETKLATDQLEETRRIHSKSVAKSTQALSELQEASSEELSSLRGKLTCEHEEAFSGLRQTLRIEVSRFEEKLSAAEGSCQDLNAELDASRAAEKGAQIALDSLSKDAARTQGHLEELLLAAEAKGEEELASLREEEHCQQAAAEASLSSLQSALVTVETDAAASAERLLQQLQHEEERSSGVLEAQIKASSDLQRQCESAEHRANEEGVAMNTLLSTKRFLDEELVDALRDADRCREETGILREELSTVEGRAQELADRCGAQDERNSQSESRCSVAEQALQDLREAQSVCEKAVQGRTEECDRLREQLKACEGRADARAAALEEQLQTSCRKEAQLSASLAQEAAARWQVGEQLTLAEERLNAEQTRAADLQAALQRSRLLERQALERAQELRASLALLREFGHEEFMRDPAATVVAPSSPAVKPAAVSRCVSIESEASVALGSEHSGEHPDGGLDDVLGNSSMLSVLISVEVDLGFSRANLIVAPWHTRSDFKNIVDAFLVENKIKNVFAEAMVAYLQAVEEEAVSFPVTTEANLSDVYSRYG